MRSIKLGTPSHLGRWLRGAAVLCFVLGLASCGGGDSQGTGPNQVKLAAKSALVAPSVSVIGITVTGITKVSETRISRTVYDYVFKVTVKNNGSEPQSGVTATLTGVGTGTTIIKGSVQVGDLVAGATTTPQDTITLRQDRTFPFNLAALIWQITASAEIGKVEPLDPAKVVTDPGTGQRIVNDQILIIFKHAMSENAEMAKINSINGVVVGYLTGMHIYQVRINGNPTVEQLKTLVDQLNNDPDVAAASLNHIHETTAARYPDDGKDPEWFNQLLYTDSYLDGWDEANPAGLNWGLEAIKAPSAWDYNDSMSSVSVGIVDGGFKIDHEDLKIGINNATGAWGRYYSIALDTPNCSSKPNTCYTHVNNHGTHVAGTLGAWSNNLKGITGILWKKDLYLYRTDFQEIDIMYGVSWNLSKGAKIINISLGVGAKTNLKDLGIVGPSDGGTLAIDTANERDYINTPRHLWSNYLWALNDTFNLNDFLIIQAAGNEAIDAKWSGLFNSVNDVELRKRIITVGSIGKYPSIPWQPVSYGLAATSNRGIMVDVVAPGEKIYSTFFDTTTSYDEMSGTSMAAPHVTGVAGLVWAANPSLTAEQVKNIIVGTADRPLTENYVNSSYKISYNILNAKKAVEMAKGIQTPDTSKPTIPTGLWASILSSSQISLAWAASTDNVGVGGYKIYRGGSLIAIQASRSIVDASLSPSTQYCYTVSAFDALGNESVQSDPVCATTHNTYLPPTTGILATPGDGQVTISWNAVTGAVSYNLYRASVSGVTKSNYSSLTGGVTSPSIQTGLTNGTTYYFVVTGVDANGDESIESIEVSATPHVGTLNDTGITSSQCYQAGSDILVACNSAGAIALNYRQDGMAGRDANAATNSNTDGKLGFSFTYVAGGCVQDNVTGLMWENKTTDGGLRDWSKTYTNYDSTTALQKWNGSAVAPTQAEIDAPTNSVGFKNSVNVQGLCGYSDWRLPSADELQSIVDYGVAYPGPTIDATWFPNTQGSQFWSASPYVVYSYFAWFVDFDYGHVFFSGRGVSNYVRLVRAGQPPILNRYTVSANGQEVTDNQTNLIWRRCAEGMVFSSGTCTGTAGTFTHEAALQLAATQASSTGIAWRLPDVKELSSIADKSLSNPAIDSTAFPATPGSLFWSASPSVGVSSYAWYVDFFEYGYVYDGYDRSVSYYVRLVRPVPAPFKMSWWSS